MKCWSKRHLPQRHGSISIYSTISLEFDRFGDTLRSIMSGVLFYQLLICAAVTAFNLFALEANGFLSLNAAVSLYLMVSAIITTFLYCFLAERFTTDLLAIGMIFYGSAWYQLPSQYQRIFVLLIKRSQRETRLKCFGLLDCSLSVFSSVGELHFGIRLVKFIFIEISLFRVF